jgi:hypothetical protein
VDPSSTLVLYCPETDAKVGVAVSSIVSVGSPPRHPSFSDHEVDPTPVSALTWLHGGLLVAVAMGDGNVLLVTRWGSVVRLLPSPAIASQLDWHPASSRHPVALSLFAPVCTALLTLRDPKHPRRGITSLWPHPGGDRLLCFDGCVLFELRLPS